MLLSEKIAVYFQNRAKHKNTRCGQNPELCNVKAASTYIYHHALQA
jgi:hypothetical protein